MNISPEFTIQDPTLLFAFISATGAGWLCDHDNGIVTCNYQSLEFDSGQSSIITIQVAAPALSGIYPNSASVSTTATDKLPDFDTSSVSMPTYVGVSTTGIQAQIDAAVAGDTLIVDSGIYVGPLDYGGKDIAIVAPGGSQNTIIHGSGSRTLSMGPGGVLQGFTIAGGVEKFGAGLNVIGSGSAVIGNVFELNNLDSGGYGAAIGGDNASPTIERNIFRDNRCSEIGGNSGIVSFINNSSPTLSNNLFENNPCGAINMVLPETASPQVINNTIVGNSRGIIFDYSIDISAQIYRNNLIVNNGYGVETDFGDPVNFPLWENNLVFGSTPDNYFGIADQTGSNGNISADPLFVDVTGSNYRLTVGSPAIDAGSATDAPTNDFDATTRPLDGDGNSVPDFDIGAFEAPAL